MNLDRGMTPPTLIYSPHCPYSRRVVQEIQKRNLDILLVDVSTIPKHVRPDDINSVPELEVNGVQIKGFLRVMQWIGGHRDQWGAFCPP